MLVMIVPHLVDRLVLVIDAVNDEGPNGGVCWTASPVCRGVGVMPMRARARGIVIVTVVVGGVAIMSHVCYVGLDTGKETDWSRNRKSKFSRTASDTYA